MPSSAVQLGAAKIEMGAIRAAESRRTCAVLRQAVVAVQSDDFMNIDVQFIHVDVDRITVQKAACGMYYAMEC